MYIVFVPSQSRMEHLYYRYMCLGLLGSWASFLVLSHLAAILGLIQIVHVRPVCVCPQSWFIQSTKPAAAQQYYVQFSNDITSQLDKHFVVMYQQHQNVRPSSRLIPPISARSAHGRLHFWQTKNGFLIYNSIIRHQNGIWWKYIWDWFNLRNEFSRRGTGKSEGKSGHNYVGENIPTKVEALEICFYIYDNVLLLAVVLNKTDLIENWPNCQKSTNFVTNLLFDVNNFVDFWQIGRILDQRTSSIQLGQCKFRQKWHHAKFSVADFNSHDYCVTVLPSLVLPESKNGTCINKIGIFLLETCDFAPIRSLKIWNIDLKWNCRWIRPSKWLREFFNMWQMWQCYLLANNEKSHF